MTIGELAKRCGVGVQTIRFYERKGLLPDPRRGGVGYREYGAEHVRKLEFVRRAQALGFTLKEIAELYALRSSSAATCEDVRTRAQRKVDEIEGKIRALKALKKALAPLLNGCPGSRRSGEDCPILKALEPPPAGNRKGSDA
ncbi:MAG: heavy metal-responsive transcriptional regulator [Planctomycetota bacterium]|nr:MAG: heavy metal-responsive transcriptional regulator [Planctomycetota bacterium]